MCRACKIIIIFYFIIKKRKVSFIYRYANHAKTKNHLDSYLTQGHQFVNLRALVRFDRNNVKTATDRTIYINNGGYWIPQINIFYKLLLLNIVKQFSKL